MRLQSIGKHSLINISQNKQQTMNCSWRHCQTEGCHSRNSLNETIFADHWYKLHYCKCSNMTTDKVATVLAVGTWLQVSNLLFNSTCVYVHLCVSRGYKQNAMPPSPNRQAIVSIFTTISIIAGSISTMKNYCQCQRSYRV